MRDAASACGVRPRRALARGAWLCCVAPCLVLGAALLACDAPPHGATTTAPQRAIYGRDDRREVFEHPDVALQDFARRSTVALVPSALLDPSDPERVALVAPSLGESHGLCEGSRFAEQPSAADCSGVLIDDDLVLTAGHCVPDEVACSALSFVFGFHYAGAGRLARISSADVFACAGLVVHSSAPDFAIVRLDRAATPRFAPARIKQGAFALRTFEPLRLIGFPSGIPAKIDDGGRVLDARAEHLDHFVGTTDSFGGNSGSPVLDAAGELVGVLVRGASDYWWDGACWMPAVYPSGGGGEGEEATYVHNALEALCALEPSAGPCAAPVAAGWCEACASDAACPADWSCVAAAVRGVSWCARPCASDLDCRIDHRCEVTRGECTPERSARCVDGDLWQVDGCGAVLRLLEHCPAGCADDACLDPCDGACAIGTTRCADGLLETCIAEAGAAGRCPGWGMPQACAADERCDGETEVCAPADAWCSACSPDGACPAGWSCADDGRCQRRCAADGDCLADHVCDTASALCVPQTFATCDDGVARQVDACGAVVEARVCAAGTVCLEGECHLAPAPSCAEGARRCGGPRSVLRCTRIDAVGTTAWRAVERCPADTACDTGACTPLSATPPALLDPDRLDLASDGGWDGSGSAEAPDPSDVAPAMRGALGGECACHLRSRAGAPASTSRALPLLALLMMFGAARLRARRRRRSR